MERVLVLGAGGMLGHMVHNYLHHNHAFDVRATVRASNPILKKAYGSSTFFLFDAEQSGDALSTLLSNYCPQYVINCIGIIKPYCKDNNKAEVERAIVINALFPHRLAVAAQRVGARVIQIATDCVFSGARGHYTEGDPHDPLDAYGKTKSLGEVQAPNVLHIRCSIIGPELKRSASLLGWFLKQPPGATLQGFAHHEWNGVTTLQFARLCEWIINGGTARFDALRSAALVHHFVPNATVNKYELLNVFTRVFEHPVVVERADALGSLVQRTLASNFTLLSVHGASRLIEEAIRELKAYMETEDYARILT